jgi:hypothetical protein
MLDIPLNNILSTPSHWTKTPANMFTTLPFLPPPPSTLLPSTTSPFTPSYTTETPSSNNPTTLAQNQQQAIQHRNRPKPHPASS